MEKYQAVVVDSREIWAAGEPHTLEEWGQILKENEVEFLIFKPFWVEWN